MTDEIIGWPAQATELMNLLEPRSITVDVENPEENRAWEDIFKQSKVPRTVGNGGHDVTLEIIRLALNFGAVLAFAGLLLFAMSRRYSISASKTAKGTYKFDMKPQPPDK